MSGLTTTGSTVLADIEAAPRGILLWRSLTQWLGAMGIVVLGVAVLRSQVLGPCFESMARYWTTHFAARTTLGGAPEHVGPTTVTVATRATGVDRTREVDVAVAADDGATPGERTVYALGEAKAGERFTLRHVHRLEEARSAMGARAGGAKLLLFGESFEDDVREAEATRADLEIVDLDRLYAGS